MNTTNTKSKKRQLKALVTGATGFLGQHLCQQLQEQGWQIFALCRSAAKAESLPEGVRVILGDILSVAKFEGSIPEDLDAIFHAAASTNTWFKNNDIQTRTNLTGTQNMLDLAVNHGVGRFIHVSSVVVFGIHAQLKNIEETMSKTGADSFINYVRTKTASEKLVHECKHLDAVVINPTHIIGPGDRHNWARLIKMIARQKLPSIPNGAGSFVDVRDVAAGIIAAYHYGQKGENYLLGGTDLDFKQFVYIVAAKLKVKPTRLQLSTRLLMLLARIKNLISTVTNNEPDITPESVTLISDLYGCDASKARKELNYRTRDFDMTINETLQFLKDEKIIST